MKTYIFLFLFCGLSYCILGQSLSPTTIASGGGEWDAETNGTISYTIGQLAVETHMNVSGILCQGFQQPYLTTTTSTDHLGLDLNIKVFPNPTTGSLNLLIDQLPNNIQLRLVDALGILHNTWLDVNENNILDIANRPSGIYFLQAFSSNQLITSIKIQKI